VEALAQEGEGITYGVDAGSLAAGEDLVRLTDLLESITARERWRGHPTGFGSSRECDEVSIQLR